jgi:SAM-dependent methyltransferase
MTFALNRLVNLEDFDEPVVQNAIREVFADEVAKSPEFPTGREQRKQWEIAMAVLALREGGALRPDAEVLGIGAGSEATLFWLTNHVRRVWATDLYADPGIWTGTAPPTMLIDPGNAWNGPWNPRRLVVQHMDACDLAYEDETFDAIFSSGSIEHFGSIDRIGKAMDEAFRVLKPGGTASFSTEYLIAGDPLLYEDQTVMFTRELIERLLIGKRGWTPVTAVDYTLSDATLGTEIEINEYVAGAEPTYPHCVLRIGPNLLTSVHIALRKTARPAILRTISDADAAPEKESEEAGSAPAQHSPTPGHRPAPPLLRRAAQAPYHPLVWRLNRNDEHGRMRAEAVEARLEEVQLRLAEMQRRFDEWGHQVLHGLTASREAIHVAQRTIHETRAANDASHDAIAAWSAVLARELSRNLDEG